MHRMVAAFGFIRRLYGFLAMLEIAIVSSRYSRFEQLADAGHADAPAGSNCPSAE
jgi:CBS domain containing-hemolysin-like protein